MKELMHPVDELTRLLGKTNADTSELDIIAIMHKNRADACPALVSSKKPPRTSSSHSRWTVEALMSGSSATPSRNELHAYHLCDRVRAPTRHLHEGARYGCRGRRWVSVLTAGTRGSATRSGGP